MFVALTVFLGLICFWYRLLRTNPTPIFMEITKKEFGRIMKRVATQQSVDKLADRVDRVQEGVDGVQGVVDRVQGTQVSMGHGLVQVQDAQVRIQNTQVRMQDTQAQMQHAQIGMQSVLAQMQEAQGQMQKVLESHTVSLDGIAKNTIHWNTEAAALRAAIQRHDEYFRVVGKKIGVDFERRKAD
jgi:hypothetical protein